MRVRVEQAIGVLAERHRLRPRQAFELLRSASRAHGRRVLEMATEVVDSATNPLLRMPEELAKPPMPRRMPRRTVARPDLAFRLTGDALRTVGRCVEPISVVVVAVCPRAWWHYM